MLEFILLVQEMRQAQLKDQKLKNRHTALSRFAKEARVDNLIKIVLDAACGSRENYERFLSQVRDGKLPG